VYFETNIYHIIFFKKRLLSPSSKKSKSGELGSSRDGDGDGSMCSLWGQVYSLYNPHLLAVSLPQVHIFLIIINNNSRNTFNFVFAAGSRRHVATWAGVSRGLGWHGRGWSGPVWVLFPIPPTIPLYFFCCLNDIALTVSAFKIYEKISHPPWGNCFRRLCPLSVCCFLLGSLRFFYFLYIFWHFLVCNINYYGRPATHTNKS